MDLKERTREIATLMVLGYNKHETANMLIVENLVITGLGCVLGLPLGYGLLWWLGAQAKSLGFCHSERKRRVFVFVTPSTSEEPSFLSL